MSYAETAIEDIKAELKHLDAAVLQSIREIIAQSKGKPFARVKSAHGSPLHGVDKATTINPPAPFVGENLLPEEYERLSNKERGALQWRLRERNRHWLQESFSKLDAAWLVVVDGKIISSGKRLQNKPLSPQILKICRRTGKFPFIFVNEKFITIEENPSALRDYTETFMHLNQPFSYIDKLLYVALPSHANAKRAIAKRISCVANWQESPFVAINPNRTALIGRDIMFELKPRVLLDFDKRQTEIVSAAKTKPPRRKAASQKNSATPKRRRT